MRVVNLNPLVGVGEGILNKQMASGQFDECVSTYDAILICNSALRKIDWNYQIYDEAHKLKNSLKG
jgi:SNF2 family DNA or RNA helicase